MPDNNNNDDDVRAGTGASPKRNLTVKQNRFAGAYVDPTQANGNGTLACKIAGYKGGPNQLGVQAYANLRNPKIQQVITSMLDSMTEPALQRVREALDATSSRVIMDKEGRLLYSKPVPDHRVRLGAAQVIFNLLSKFAAVDEEHQLDEVGEDVVGAEQINPADQVLLEEAAAIDAELGELNSELNGDPDCEHDHDPDE